MQIFRPNENMKHERLLGFQYGCTFVLPFEQMLANKPLWKIKGTVSGDVSRCPRGLSSLARVESSSPAARGQGFIFLPGGFSPLYATLPYSTSFFLFQILPFVLILMHWHLVEAERSFRAVEV